MLTKKQKQVLEFVKKFIYKKEIAPSLDEIKEHFNMASVSTAHHHIRALQNLGYLQKEENHPRTLSILENNTMLQIPLMGLISAGQPIEAICQREIISFPRNKLPGDGNFYALKVTGNSMIDENINDGDIVIIKKQEYAENGQKVVALIDNQDVTLKKIFSEKGYTRLQPANKTLKPIMIEKGRDLSIQGIVVEIIKNNEKFEIKENTQSEENKNLPTNQIICGDCVEVMKGWPSNSVDVVITSPPYDGVRKYNGFDYDLHKTGVELFRILKEGGIVAMVIQDQTKNFGKTLTTFRTIVDWVDNIGFKLFENIIYKKHGAEGAWWTKRFRVDHEYIPIFLKGERPKYFEKEHLKIPSKHGGKTMTGCATRLTNGKTLSSKKVTINPLKCRGTIWDYTTCGDGTRLKHEHPATFPDKIPYDFIKCFCSENGIVLDPFVGSGTTILSAINLDRKYIGIDISKDYCMLCEKRIALEGEKNNKLF